MARLPNPGGDNGTWGAILNEFLEEAHNADGSIKNTGLVASKYTKPASGIPLQDLHQTIQDSLLGPGVITNSHISDGAAITQSKIANLTADLAGKAAAAHTHAIADVTNLQSALDGKLATSTSITNPSTQTWGRIDIFDDGSPTASWPDRFKAVYTPQGSTERQTFWLNEYGEARGLPATQNGVTARWYAAVNSSGYASRNTTSPIVEVTDQRDGTRTTLFGVYKGGRITLTRLEVAETLTTAAAKPWFVENLNYSIATTNTNHMELLVQGIIKFWMNEWGAIRGTSPYAWGDALVRAVRDNGDGITAGNALELVDRRTAAPATTLWGVRWTDGQMVQADHPVGAVYTLEHDQDESDIPANLPAGTLIVRKTV